MSDEKEYKVGDVVWIVVHGGNGSIAVKCKVTYVDDQFRKTHGPTGVLFYDLDEPVGHSLGAEQLADSREDVEEVLRENAQEALMSGNDMFQPNLTLEQYRLDTMGFIVSTWGDESKGKEQEIITAQLKEYPPKEHLVDWFNCSDLLT
jgi:hypothetical protein